MDKKTIKLMAKTYCKARDLIFQLDITDEQKLGFCEIFSNITNTIATMSNKNG